MARHEVTQAVRALLDQCHDDYNSAAAAHIRANMSKHQRLEAAKRTAAEFNRRQRARRDGEL